MAQRVEEVIVPDDTIQCLKKLESKGYDKPVTMLTQNQLHPKPRRSTILGMGIQWFGLNFLEPLHKFGD